LGKLCFKIKMFVQFFQQKNARFKERSKKAWSDLILNNNFILDNITIFQKIYNFRLRNHNSIYCITKFQAKSLLAHFLILVLKLLTHTVISVFLPKNNRCKLKIILILAYIENIENITRNKKFEFRLFQGCINFF
jgi:hypothetical protein